MIVPTANEIVEAANVPTFLPSPELIGACRATSAPAAAVRRTATHLSTRPRSPQPRLTLRPAPHPRDRAIDGTADARSSQCRGTGVRVVGMGVGLLNDGQTFG